MLKIYVCGPTVYNDPHIGNMRPIVTFDLILKAARFLGISFEFVHNITDIDDKIIKAALENNVSEKEIATKYSESYLELLKNFNIDTVTKLEYVTENIDTISEFISKILENNSAYIKENNVWFDVDKNKNHYGDVSNQKLDNMLFEDLQYQKNHPADFALWKSTTTGIKFNSPFGLGRPGWHTECAALILKNFGNQGVDIHGGGMDLTFPHHENENIQFLSVTGNPITKKWLRIGQINLNGEKMSKSLQNVILAKDFINEYGADVLKFIFLLSSFTGTINIDEALIANVKKILRRIKIVFFTAHKNQLINQETNFNSTKLALDALYNLNFAEFNKIVNKLLKEANSGVNTEAILNIVQIFTILQFECSKFDYSEAIQLFNHWNELKAKSDYKNADIVREQLQKLELV
ncbi:cysteine--tRNA ligase [Mycoplasma corogypsi]|uniref:cysteine--tRNA ligase n=1 Tax=Mycoplasma corogypsi TaxID=2106 RepID=UPI0038730EBE